MRKIWLSVTVQHCDTHTFRWVKRKSVIGVVLLPVKVSRSLTLWSARYADNSSHLTRRLYVGLKAIHVNRTVRFVLLLVSRGNQRPLPVCGWPDALLQSHELGHVGREQLMFDPRGRGPVAAIVVVTVHQRRGVRRGFGLTNQRHLNERGHGLVSVLRTQIIYRTSHQERCVLMKRNRIRWSVTDMYRLYINALLFGRRTYSIITVITVTNSFIKVFYFQVFINLCLLLE